MKKSILMLAAGALFMVTPSCKKGEDDPALSLSSRKGRISGEWKLTTASWTEESKSSWGGNDYTYKDVYNYDGTNLKWVSSTTTSGGTITDPEVSVTFSMIVEFEKDGAYNSTMTFDGDVSTEAGFWYFAGKSKAMELKNKEAVIISLTESVDAGNITMYTGTALDADNMMFLSRLSGKEMVVSIDNKTTWSDGDWDSSIGTWTFEKQ